MGVVVIVQVAYHRNTLTVHSHRLHVSKQRMHHVNLSTMMDRPSGFKDNPLGRTRARAHRGPGLVRTMCHRTEDVHSHLTDHVISHRTDHVSSHRIAHLT